jgi:hypothetical protein
MLKKGSRTPWGAAQSVRELIPGVWTVSTSGHGGIKLSPERHKALPESLRMGGFGGDRSRAWYEEDCEACIPLAFFFDELESAGAFSGSDARESLARSLAGWLPDAFETLVAAGKLTPSEESARRLLDAQWRARIAREESRS